MSIPRQAQTILIDTSDSHFVIHILKFPQNKDDSHPILQIEVCGGFFRLNPKIVHCAEDLFRVGSQLAFILDNSERITTQPIERMQLFDARGNEIASYPDGKGDYFFSPNT